MIKSHICDICSGSAYLKYRGNIKARDFFLSAADYAISGNGGGLKLDVYVCARCGLGFSPPEVTAADIAAFYKKQPEDREYIAEEYGRRKAFGRVIGNIEKFVPSRGKILDFGAGPGLFLDEARKHGWEVYGVESAVWARLYAKENLKMDLGGEGDLDRFSDGYFDVITLFDAIEHVVSPSELIKRVSAKLKPGGLFVLTTPRFESLTRKILGRLWYCMFPAHLWYFTRKSLDILFAKYGLRSISWKRHIFYFSARYIFYRASVLLPPLKFLAAHYDLGIWPFSLGEEWEVYVTKGKL